MAIFAESLGLENYDGAAPAPFFDDEIDGKNNKGCGSYEMESESVREEHEEFQEEPDEDWYRVGKYEKHGGNSGLVALSLVNTVPLMLQSVASARPDLFPKFIQTQPTGGCYSFYPVMMQQPDLTIVASSSDPDIKCEQGGQSCKITFNVKASRVSKKDPICVSQDIRVTQRNLTCLMKIQIKPHGTSFLAAGGWAKMSVKSTGDYQPFSAISRGTFGSLPMTQWVPADFQDGVICEIPGLFHLWSNSGSVVALLEFSPACNFTWQ